MYHFSLCQNTFKKTCITLNSATHYQRYNFLKSFMPLYIIKYRFICSFIVKFLEHRVMTQSCDGDWVRYGDSCYRYYTSQMRWMYAFKTCQSDNGFLTDIENADEQAFLQSNFNQCTLCRLSCRIIFTNTQHKNFYKIWITC